MPLEKLVVNGSMSMDRAALLSSPGATFIGKINLDALVVLGKTKYPSAIHALDIARYDDEEYMDAFLRRLRQDPDVSDPARPVDMTFEDEGRTLHLRNVLAVEFRFVH